MKILITGSNGLLGQKIVGQLTAGNIEFLATSKGDNRNSKCDIKKYQSLDITSKSELDNIISSFNPTHIINTAAVTNVDFCEDHKVLCQDVNVHAVKLMFKICTSKNIHFIQLSTDFVFDGQNGPYIETDKPNPLSVYAKSKYNAEKVLINNQYKNWSILRTIIVYGEGENLSRSNIVLWAKSALAKGESLTIVDDQFRSPTWADDLAWACIAAVKRNVKGIYHISGPKTYSIFDLVCEIADYYNFDKTVVKPIKSKTLNQKALRPPKTGFVIDKAIRDLGYKPKTIIETLQYIS